MLAGEYREDAPQGELPLTSGGLHHDVEAVEIYADAITPDTVDRVLVWSIYFHVFDPGPKFRQLPPSVGVYHGNALPLTGFSAVT